MAIKIAINSKTLILASLYMDAEDKSFPPESLNELTKYAKQIDALLIVGSDTNSHHTIRGDKKTRQKRRSSTGKPQQLWPIMG